MLTVDLVHFHGSAMVDQNGVLKHYEPRFWGLDPVFSARVKLSIIDVISLSPHPIIPEVYCISNHPVQSVHIMGDVVAIQRKSRMIKYEVDDGTGVLQCTHWREQEDSDEGLFIPELGQLVSVWGKLSEYKEEKQLTVTAIAPQDDPNAEPLHWLEAAHLKKTVYSVPFTPHPKFLSGPDAAGISLKNDIRLAVMKFLNESYSGKNFTLPELLANAELLKFCVESTVAESRGGSGHEAEVRQEVGKIVRELPQVGAVVVAIGTGKQLEPRYEVFSTKKHLHPPILEFIKWKEKITESVVRLGVPEDWIVKFIQKKEAYQNIPPVVIQNAIAELEEQSLIYSFMTKSYKAVT